MANEFLKKLANAGIPELARMPHALDPERGFRVRSEFTFLEYRDVANPASPLRWLADLVLGLVGAGWIIRNEARRFLTKLLESNSTRVQSDILNRVQESRGKLETEIRKLLHEVSRIAEQALARAKRYAKKVPRQLRPNYGGSTPWNRKCAHSVRLESRKIELMPDFPPIQARCESLCPVREFLAWLTFLVE